MPHKEWRYILHADLDAFYASVEQGDNPRLRGLPVLVGGSPEGRGVVAAASYEAREFGVRSAIPMGRALRLCPEAVRVAPRFDRYREVSQQIMRIFRDLTPLVEPISLDEAYMDISRQIGADQVEEVARGLRRMIRDQTGLSATVGGGVCKTVAKIASQIAKPDGLLLVRPGRERSFLAPLDIDLLWGVGPRTAGILRGHGINTIGDLTYSDLSWLKETLGKRGPELMDRALGRERDPVEPYRETKSISAEATLLRDAGNEAFLRRKLRDLAHDVATRLHNEGLMGRTVSVKLRLADFSTFTRQQTFPTPTADEETIYSVAHQLLHKEMRPGIKFRLLGVGVTSFRYRKDQESSQLSLFSAT